MSNPHGRNFYAPVKRRTKVKLVDDLLVGSRNVVQYHEFDNCTPQMKAIIQELVDRVRPLQIRARQLDIQLENLKTLHNKRNPHVENQWEEEK